MIEQLHPKTRHGFVININTVSLREFLQRLPHPHGRVIEGGFRQVSQSHCDVSAVMELRRQNGRLLEGAHEFAHFLVVCEIANLRFQRYPAGANRVQRKRTITAPMTDMMNPAGWKAEPGSGLEKSLPINPPTTPPTIPSRVVLISPMACAPGMTARATRPTTKPTMMCQMMCSIGFLRLDGATVHGRFAADHHFSPLADAFLSLATVPHIELFSRHDSTRTAENQRKRAGKNFPA